METLKPLPPPGPPQSGKPFWVPLLINAVLLLLFNSLPEAESGLNIALVFVAMQLFANFMFALGAFFGEEQRWGAGFVLSGLLVLLVGVGMCGQNL